ncbi:MAG: polysaccharide biosynthesis tyrosine autokinase [Melioribacteraceae bacterium]
MISLDTIVPTLKEKKLIVISAIIAGLLLALAITFFLPKLYRSSARIDFKFESVNSSLLKSNGSLLNEVTRVRSDKNLLSSAKKIVKSESRGNFTLLNSVIKEIGSSDLNSNALLNSYAKKINETAEIISDDPSTSIRVKVVTQNSIESSEIANAIVNSFTEYSIPNSNKTYLSNLRVIEKRKKDNLSSIQRNNNNFNEYIVNASLKTLSPKDEKLVDRIAELEAELESVELDNNYFISHLGYLQNILGLEFADINSTIFSLDNADIRNTKSLIEKIKTEKIMTLATKGISNLNVKYPWKELNSNKNIDSLNNKLRDVVFNLVKNKFAETPNSSSLKNLVWKIEETNSDINAIDFSKSIIYNLLTSLESEFNAIPMRYIELARLIRAKKFNSKLDLKLKSKEIKLKGKEDKYLSEVDSITEAITPSTYFSPNSTLNLILGFLGGLLLGVFYTLYTSSVSVDNIAFADDLEKAGFKVISQVPKIPNSPTSTIELHSQIKTSVEETKFVKSFQNIDSFLKYGNLEKEIKSLLITSSAEQEGKTLVAANIATAIAIANKDERVLLVDINFKTPMLDKILNVSPSHSLPHYLFKKKDLSNIINTTSIDNLSLISSIELTQNPAVIIASERMKDFIKKVNSEFDYVIYDTSSLCSLKETTEIAKDIDAVILVARANQTQLPQLKTTEEILKDSGITNFNVILNDVEI